MFHPSEMEEEATLREDLEDDIKTECTKMGPVEKVSDEAGSHLINRLALATVQAHQPNVSVYLVFQSWSLNVISASFGAG